MRKLASIQKISAIRPIPGADFIVAVDVLGWTVVCKKDDFQVGDAVVYFEIDSWLDAQNPVFGSFVDRFSNWGDKRGMRLKTIKLRKQISQGLVLAISEFPELSASVLGLDKLKEGDDVTEILRIEKWESLADQRESNGPNKAAGAKPFPSFIRKTDQERVQNYVGHLAQHLDETFEVTIKLDGSSMTVFHVPKTSPYSAHCMEDMEVRLMKRMTYFGKLFYKIKKALRFIQQPAVSGVCSRNIQLPVDEDNHFSKFYRDNKLAEVLDKYGKAIAVQGELLAPSIQGNYEKVDKFEFYVFDIFDIDTQVYMTPPEVSIIADELGLQSVPVLKQVCKLSDFGDTSDMRGVVDNILAYAEGPGMNKGVKREGVVFKSNQSEFSFKAISNSYLLKKDAQ